MFQDSVQNSVGMPLPSNIFPVARKYNRQLLLPPVDLHALPRMAPDREILTDREIEVLSWIAGGRSDWQVGQILMISHKTVNFHVENAKHKLDARTRTQAIIRARDYGLLDVLPVEPPALS